MRPRGCGAKESDLVEVDVHSALTADPPADGQAPRDRRFPHGTGTDDDRHVADRALRQLLGVGGAGSGCHQGGSGAGQAYGVAPRGVDHGGDEGGIG